MEIDLTATRVSDFDGHTNFESMSLEARLAWLSSAVQFYWMVRTPGTNVSFGDETLGGN